MKVSMKAFGAATRTRTSPLDAQEEQPPVVIESPDQLDDLVVFDKVAGPAAQGLRARLV